MKPLRINKEIVVTGNALVRYVTKRYTLKQKHVGATSSLSETYGSTNGLEATVTVLGTTGNAIGMILNLFREVRDDINSMGVLLPEKQGVLIRASDLDEVYRIYTESCQSLRQHKDILLAQYDKLVETQKRKLNRAADTLTYPPAQVVADSFSHHLYVLKAPEAIDFLHGVSEEVADKTRAYTKASETHMYEEIVGNLLRSMLVFLVGNGSDPGLVGHVRDAKVLKRNRFENLDRAIEHASRARDSLGINMEEFDQVIDLFKTLQGLDVDLLRENESHRTEVGNRIAQTAGETTNILKSIGAM